MNTLTYKIDGSGEPLVLLNGGMMTIAAWDEIAIPLAQEFRVIRCDFRGQLLSPGIPPPDLNAHASDLVNLLDALGIDSAHLVGTSFGAEVAIVAAARYPRRVRSLVAATAFDHATPEMSELAQKVRDAALADVRGPERTHMFDAMLPTTYGETYLAENAAFLDVRRDRVATLPPEWFAGVDAILAAVQHCDLRPLLPLISCPTLIVVAGLDRTAPPQRGRALAEQIEGARLFEVPESAHALVVEHPERLVEACFRFLAAVAPR